jgi:hypothetical protein
MTRNIFFVTVGSVVVILLAIGIYVYKVRTGPANQTAPNQITSANPLPPGQNVPIIPGKKPGNEKTFDIGTAQGDTTVNNFYNLPETQPVSGDGVNFKNSTYYYMAYYPNQQGFIITILDPDIEKARKIAEADFIQALGITKDQACNLNVSLTVAPEADNRASGGNYRLSFCPNGKPFPTD